MNEPPIAVVTGANRGPGYEVCRQLKAGGARVVLTARDAEKGHAAAAELGQMTSMGAGTPAYRISKAALNAATAVFAAEMVGTPVKINACCPGWVATDMGGSDGPRSRQEGADTAVWLATLPEDGPSGGFFQDRKRIHW